MSQKPNQRPGMEPYFGRDEMNLVEFPIGPIGKTSRKTLEVDHVVFDRETKREVTRRLVITGSDAYGLPKAIDDQVLIGLMALTHDAGYEARKVHFSRHRLCNILGWGHNGRSYQRVEHSLDRLTGTTFKFKNSWFDKGEKEWRSHSFHLIDNYELCSRDRYIKWRTRNKTTKQSLCYFVWNEVIWKSLTDGYIKKVDMKMFRRVANGRRREAALRLYRWLDKQFYKQRAVVKFDLMSLCNGTIGYSYKFPSDAMRSMQKAAEILIEAGFLSSVSFTETYRGWDVTFRKATRKRTSATTKRADLAEPARREDKFLQWVSRQSETKLFELESTALAENFGGKFLQDQVQSDRSKNTPFQESSDIRKLYVYNYAATTHASSVGIS